MIIPQSIIFTCWPISGLPETISPIIFIEFSKKENTYFGVAEIENSIKIMGEIVSESPEIGQQVNIIDCGIINDNYFFKMKVVD